MGENLIFATNTKILLRYFRAMVDAATKKALSGIPLMKTKAGPRDKEVHIWWLPQLNSTSTLPGVGHQIERGIYGIDQVRIRDKERNCTTW